ncbi:MAG: hypothetical protein NC324_01905 [Bacteroides sp.]|nr:hypothetical protein [Bacteroides sp.]
MLRLFLRMVRPSNEQLCKVQSNGRSRFRIKMYKFLLKRLKRSYLYYAISDTIVLQNEDIRIVHEFRDMAFENELRRVGVDIRPQMASSAMPCRMARRGNQHHYKCFKFKDLLNFYRGNEELFLTHDKEISVEGTMRGGVKKSLSEDIVFRTTTLLEENVVVRMQNSYSYDILKTVSAGISQSKSTPKNAYTRHRGVEEDESF